MPNDEDVLLASLASVASERDDVLTLLSSVTSGMFGLLGSPENSTRLLTGTQRLVDLLRLVDEQERLKASKSSGLSQAVNATPCGEWASFVEYSNNVLSGMVALQRQLWSHSKWIDPELLASVAARAECPKPPTPPPQSNSSLLEQTPSFTTTCLPSPVPAVESRNAALAPLVPPSSASSPEAATRTSEPAENESTTADSVIIEDMVPPTLPSASELRVFTAAPPGVPPLQPHELLVLVKCPEGALGGSPLEMEVEGSPYRITVPPKIQPGQPFYVRVPRAVKIPPTSRDTADAGADASAAPESGSSRKTSLLPDSAPVPPQSSSPSRSAPSSNDKDIHEKEHSDTRNEDTTSISNDFANVNENYTTGSHNYPPGAQAVVVGLTKMPTSNGRPCQVLSYDDEGSRYHVQFTDTEGGLGCLKLENLKLVPESSKTDGHGHATTESTDSSSSAVELPATATNNTMANTADASKNSTSSQLHTTSANEASSSSQDRKFLNARSLAASQRRKTKLKGKAALALAEAQREASILRKELVTCYDTIDNLRDQRLYGPAVVNEIGAGRGEASTLLPSEGRGDVATPRSAHEHTEEEEIDRSWTRDTVAEGFNHKRDSNHISSARSRGLVAAAALGAGELLDLLEVERREVERAKTLASVATAREDSLSSSVDDLMHLALCAGAVNVTAAGANMNTNAGVSNKSNSGSHAGDIDSRGEAKIISQPSRSENEGSPGEGSRGDANDSGADEEVAVATNDFPSMTSTTSTPSDLADQASVPERRGAPPSWVAALRAAVAEQGDALEAQRNEVTALQAQVAKLEWGRKFELKLVHAASGRLRARLRHTESLLETSRLKSMELEFELVAYGILRPWEVQNSNSSSSSSSSSSGSSSGVQRPSQSRLGPWPDSTPPPPSSPLRSRSHSSSSVPSGASGVPPPPPPSSSSSIVGIGVHSPGLNSSGQVSTSRSGAHALPVEPIGPGARPGSSVNVGEPVSMLSAETAARAAALHAERLGWHADCNYFAEEAARYAIDPDEDGGGGGCGDGRSSSSYDEHSDRFTSKPIEKSSTTTISLGHAQRDNMRLGRWTSAQASVPNTRSGRVEARAAAAAAALGGRMEAWLEEKYEWDETTGELVGPWGQVESLEPPSSAHDLHSPVVTEMLSAWTSDQAKQKALLSWMARVLDGDALQPEHNANGRPKVPALQLLRLPKDTLGGFAAVVVPLLLRRRDARVAVYTRERRTVVYDLRVQVDSANGPPPTPPPPLSSGMGKSFTQSSYGMMTSPSPSTTTPGFTPQSPLRPRPASWDSDLRSSPSSDHLQRPSSPLAQGGFHQSQMSTGAEDLSAAWKQEHAFSLRAALTGHVSDGYSSEEGSYDDSSYDEEDD